MFAGSEPVYRDCAVDREARLLTRNLEPEFTPPGYSGCYAAELEYVVDTAGRVELSTARISTSNDPTFARAVMAMLPRYKYDPARIAGRPVRQIVRDERKLFTELVAVRVGAPLPPPSRPPC